MGGRIAGWKRVIGLDLEGAVLPIVVTRGRSAPSGTDREQGGGGTQAEEDPR
jgi:hypothetical protein